MVHHLQILLNKHAKNKNRSTEISKIEQKEIRRMLLAPVASKGWRFADKEMVTILH